MFLVRHFHSILVVFLSSTSLITWSHVWISAHQELSRPPHLLVLPRPTPGTAVPTHRYVMIYTWYDTHCWCNDCNYCAIWCNLHGFVCCVLWCIMLCYAREYCCYCSLSTSLSRLLSLFSCQYFLMLFVSMPCALARCSYLEVLRYPVQAQNIASIRTSWGDPQVS